jgi:hypothetical protein
MINTAQDKTSGFCQLAGRYRAMVFPPVCAARPRQPDAQASVPAPALWANQAAGRSNQAVTSWSARPLNCEHSLLPLNVGKSAKSGL